MAEGRFDSKLISPNEELSIHFKNAKESTNPFRCLQISVSADNCEMFLKDKSMKTNEEWQLDLGEFIAKLEQDDSPFFLLVHVDYDVENWLLIHVVPPKSNVREKMVAASTKISLKNSFGSNLITTELFVDDYDDLDPQKIKHAIDSKNDSVYSNEELERIEEENLGAEHKTQQEFRTETGAFRISCFQVDENDKQEIEKFKDGQYSIIRFGLTEEYEKVVFAGTVKHFEPLSDTYKYSKNSQEKVLLPEDLEPGFILFIFKHINPTSRKPRERVIMVKYNGWEQSPVKLRFALTYNQKSFLAKMSELLQQLVLPIEVDSLKEVTDKTLLERLYPEENEKDRISDIEPGSPLKFNKPTPPKSRGKKRIITLESLSKQE